LRIYQTLSGSSIYPSLGYEEIAAKLRRFPLTKDFRTFHNLVGAPSSPLIPCSFWTRAEVSDLWLQSPVDKSCNGKNVCDVTEAISNSAPPRKESAVALESGDFAQLVSSHVSFKHTLIRPPLRPQRMRSSVSADLGERVA
jgi:hypothetical protein